MWERASQHNKPHCDPGNARGVRGPRHAHVEAARALHVHEEGVRRLHKALQLMALQLKLPRRVQQINIAHRDARLRESREGKRDLSKERERCPRRQSQQRAQQLLPLCSGNRRSASDGVGAANRWYHYQQRADHRRLLPRAQASQCNAHHDV